MENYHILQIKPLGITNTQGLRVKITSQRFKQSVTIPWDNEPGEILHCTEIARRWLYLNGFDVIGKAEGNADYDYIITNTFEPLKPFKS